MKKRPNIVYMMSDDHAAHAMSCYGSRINETPNLDRIAQEGMRFDNCFCTNSICTPSRAAILTGTHNHINGCTTLSTHLDNRTLTFPALLKDAGYETAVFGKWHLGTGATHCPAGFDDWAVLPGQGTYHDPEFVFKAPDGGEKRLVEGYVTDIITDMTLDWIKERDGTRPFMVLCHHKAPHRRWESDEKHARMYEDVEIPEPETLYDDYADRAQAATLAKMRVGEHMREADLGEPIPSDLKGHALRKWAYQRYIKRYLRVVASIDDNVGRLLDYLDESGLAENTLVVYTSDQGFFLGDHGWYDKRFMYEDSLRMPFIIRYPQEIKPGDVTDAIITNVDFATTFLDYAGLARPETFQGTSFRPLLNGKTPDDWQQSMYYRYWMNGTEHNVAAHYGVRTKRYKLIYYYYDGCGQAGTRQDLLSAEAGTTRIADGDCIPEWELFDLEKDPYELVNVFDDPAYAETVQTLKTELRRLQDTFADTPHHSDSFACHNTKQWE